MLLQRVLPVCMKHQMRLVHPRERNTEDATGTSSTRAASAAAAGPPTGYTARCVVAQRTRLAVHSQQLFRTSSLARPPLLPANRRRRHRMGRGLPRQSFRAVKGDLCLTNKAITIEKF